MILELEEEFKTQKLEEENEKKRKTEYLEKTRNKKNGRQ